MATFRRKDQQLTDARPAIQEFWAWWADNRADVIAAADADDEARLEALLGPAVAALHPDLSWELAGGADARFALVVSGGAHLGLRALAERWCDAAPDADADVEFAPQRRPNPGVFDTVVDVDDYEIPMGELVAGTRMGREGRMDVVIHHPLFPLLAEPTRREVAFRALYAALGEDDVERWLGAVDVSPDAPIDAFAVSALPAVVDQLRPGGSPVQPTWAVLKGTSRFGPVMATVRRPFTRVDRPLCDTYVGVVASYPGGKDGLPADDAVNNAIQELGEQLLAALGGDGRHAVLIGHEVMAKRAFVHLYVDGLAVDPQAARSVLGDWPHGRIKLVTKPDPAWRRVSRLLG